MAEWDLGSLVSIKVRICLPPYFLHKSVTQRLPAIILTTIPGYAGNPLLVLMRSTTVATLRKGYGKDAAEKGYRQLSARPWTQQEVADVLDHLQRKIDKATGMPRLLLMRDALLFTLLWQTKSRGNNAGMWRLENLRLPTGEINMSQKCLLLLPTIICCFVIN